MIRAITRIGKVKVNCVHEVGAPVASTNSSMSSWVVASMNGSSLARSARRAKCGVRMRRWRECSSPSISRMVRPMTIPMPRAFARAEKVSASRMPASTSS